ncbi:MAG: bifunctional precorrin-2 dehydrogenase/sirohydrochlorin ferrochelatase [Coriobacteriales bacterium]|jgi:precorrin-2 dehydrogenase/sirohydrochlorin ferrochelatase|nr:bifunctional precorrin-2 dehydrogenase/sirohydrochlorin ferrochelatase [Coriobacteriales bacterium]
MPRPKKRYPLFLDLADRPVLVVGGGSVAERKVMTLLDYQAKLLVVAKQASPGLKQLAAVGRIELALRPYLSADCSFQRLVFCATDDSALNRQVFLDAHRAGALCNVVDVPALCDFFVPSSFSRGPLQVAVSSGGASPTLAKSIRRRLETEYDQSWGPYLELLAAVRALLLEPGSTYQAQLEAMGVGRKEFFETLAELPLRKRVASGTEPSAPEALQEALAVLADRQVSDGSATMPPCAPGAAL